MPTADNNHILNYSLKMQNYALMCHMTHTIAGGLATFAFKTMFGNKIEAVTMNYFGERKSNIA